jgi:hypothetical protein
MQYCMCRFTGGAGGAGGAAAADYVPGQEWAVLAVPYTATCTGVVLCQLDANGVQ